MVLWVSCIHLRGNWLDPWELIAAVSTLGTKGAKYSKDGSGSETPKTILLKIYQWMSPCYSTEYLQYTVAYKIPSPHSIDNDQYTVYTVYIYIITHQPVVIDPNYEVQMLLKDIHWIVYQHIYIQYMVIEDPDQNIAKKDRIR